MTVITTEPSGCRHCYACVRRCPTKAARVRAGGPDVVRERCVGCGQCVAACTRRVRTVVDNLSHVEGLLAGDPTCIMLAPSFIAACEARPGQMVAALRRAGFAGVYEVAFGADLVSRQYRRLREGDARRLLLTSPCPAAVELVRRFAPELVAFLAPVLSPMAATGKALKQRARRGCNTVFAGPCPAKLAEAKTTAVSTWVDVAITFDDLRRLLFKQGIDPAALADEDFDAPHPAPGTVYPIPGGLTLAAQLGEDLIHHRATLVYGGNEILDLLGALRQRVRLGQPDGIETHWYELLLCRGCIAAPGLERGASLFERRDRVIAQARARHPSTECGGQDDLARFSDLDLSRSFESEASRTDTQSPLSQLGPSAPAEELDIDHVQAELDETRAELARVEELACARRLLMAHELKAPLAAVEGYLRLLRDGAFDQQREKCESILTRCLDRVHALRDLVQDLLDISRRERTGGHRADEPVDVAAVASRVLDAYKDEAARRGIRMTLDAENLPLLPYVPSAELERMIANLVSNAVKYNRDDGRVGVRVRSREDSALVEVQDTGVGMTREESERLGEHFFRAKNAQTRHVVGTGLGIALVKTMIESYGGALEVDTSPGMGSTFRLVLPNGRTESPSPCAERKS